MAERRNYTSEEMKVRLSLLESKIDDNSKKIESLDKDMDSVKLELPEIRLMKKVVMSLIAFILTSFMVLTWTSVVNNKQEMSVNDVAKKVLEEYNKHGN